MSGETEQAVSGWTVDTLHSHIQTQLKDLRALLDERDVRQREAVTVALSSIQERLAAVNEFRGQLADQAATFLPRNEASALMAGLTEKVDALATRLDKSEGRGAGLSAGWVYLLGAVAALGTIVSVAVVFIAR